MRRVLDQVVPPKTAIAFEVRQGQHLRITDLEGQQVADIVLWNLDNLREKLSTAYTRNRYFPDTTGSDYFPRDTVTAGSWLMSNLCRPMMTIVTETPEQKGMHGLHHRMCNHFFYAVFGGEWRDGCFENISRAVAPYGLLPEDVPDSMDVFMNYPHNCELGHFTILEPCTKPGDFIEMRAEMNCLVGFSNCPEDLVSEVNGRHCTPMMIEVEEDPTYESKPILTPDEWLLRETERRGIHVRKPAGA